MSNKFFYSNPWSLLQQNFYKQTLKSQQCQDLSLTPTWRYSIVWDFSLTLSAVLLKNHYYAVPAETCKLRLTRNNPPLLNISYTAIQTDYIHLTQDHNMLKFANLLLRLSVAEHRQQDFLSRPTHSREQHCAQSPEINYQSTHKLCRRAPQKQHQVRLTCRTPSVL